MDERELALRRAIFDSFAATGAPPAPDDPDTLRALAEQHVVVLDEAGRVVMAHPFAAPGASTTVESSGRTWWGNCAWDGLGIVAALALPDATLTSNGVAVRVRAGEPADRALFHVEVPARHWWDDIAYT